MKTKMVAIHTIHRAKKPGKDGNKEKGIARISPVNEVITPKTSFLCSPEEAAFYVSVGAAEYAEQGEEDKVPTPVTATAAPEGTDESSLSEDGSEPLSGGSDPEGEPEGDPEEEAAEPEGDPDDQEDLVG